MCIDTFKKNIQWMLDVILDSAILPAELDFLNEEERKQAIQDKNAINNSYRNINKIFQLKITKLKLSSDLSSKNKGEQLNFLRQIRTEEIYHQQI